MGLIAQPPCFTRMATEPDELFQADPSLTKKRRFEEQVQKEKMLWRKDMNDSKRFEQLRESHAKRFF